MNSTSHADNMIPLINAPKERRVTKNEYDWEREVKHILSDFHVPRAEINKICREVEKEAKVADSSDTLYERARRKGIKYAFS